MPRPPIDDLPVELLVVIFKHVFFVSDGYLVRLNRCGGNPYNVALTSRRWKAIVYSTPQLWGILPGNYPQFWEGCLDRSESEPLWLEWDEEAPTLDRNPKLDAVAAFKFRQCLDEGRQALLDNPSRLQGLDLKHCSRRGLTDFLELIRVPPSLSLRYVHMAGDKDNVWSGYAKFLTFIQGLPQMTYLGLEGGCIPFITPGTAHSQTQFTHPNLRCLHLRGRAQRVFGLLELAPLQTLERLKVQAECTRDILDVTSLSPQRALRDLWGGRREAPSSLVVLSSSVGLQKITLGQCQTPGREPEFGDDVPLLELTVTGFNGTTRTAWKQLIGVLPLADVEEVILHIPLHSSDAKNIVELVPQANRIIAAGPHAGVVAGAL